MKKVKILLALVLALLLATTALPLMASASATDYELQEKFTIDFSSFPSSNWRFLTANQMSIDNGRMKFPGARNGNEDYANRAFLVANAQSDAYRVVQGTDYVLKFDLWLDADEALSTKMVQLSFTPALWSGASGWVYGSSEKGGGVTCDTLTIESQEENGDYIVYRLAIPFTAPAKSTMALSVFRHVSTAAGAAYYVDNLTLYEKVYPQAVCTHENTTTTDANVVEPTYFTAGSKDVVCECGETVEEDVVIPCDTANPVKFSAPVLNPTTNELEVKWEYSNALVEDLAKATNKELVVKFAFGDKEYSVKLDEVSELGEVLSIGGINADRFSKDFSVKLEFVVDAYDTTALNAAAKLAAVKVSDTVDVNNAKAEAYADLIEEIGKVDEAVVAGEGQDNDDFTADYFKVDIKAGTAEIKFVATDTLIKELQDNKDYNTGRTVKLVITIGDESHDVTLNELRSNITVKISGLSFDQMYGSISAKLVIDYKAIEDIETQAVTFNFTNAVNASDLAAAQALEALLG